MNVWHKLCLQIDNKEAEYAAEKSLGKKNSRNMWSCCGKTHLFNDIFKCFIFLHKVANFVFGISINV